MIILDGVVENYIITRGDLISAQVGSGNGYDWSSIDAQSVESNYCVPAFAANVGFSFRDYTYSSAESNRLLPVQYYVCLNPKILFSSRNG